MIPSQFHSIFDTDHEQDGDGDLDHDHDDFEFDEPILEEDEEDDEPFADESVEDPPAAKIPTNPPVLDINLGSPNSFSFAIP